MYQAELLRQRLLPLVGWRVDPKVPINIVLNASESGLFFQDEHPLLMLENIRAFAPDFAGIAGDPFSDWLKTQTEAGIIKGVQRIINERIISRSAKGILDSRMVFSQPVPQTFAPSDGRVVGFEIWPLRSYGVIVRIERIGLTFATNGIVNLRLFHSGSLAPLREIPLNYTRAGQIQWFTLAEPLVLPYLSDTTGSGGVWFLAYERTMQAVLNTDTSQIGLQRFCKVIPFESNLPFATLWDYSQNEKSKVAHGINLQISVVSDFTSFLIDQRAALTDIVSKSVAIHLLREMAFNPSVKISHRESNIRRVELLYEIDGDSTSLKKSGLGYQLDQSIKALQLDWDDIDGAVFKRPAGVKYRTI